MRTDSRTLNLEREVRDLKRQLGKVPTRFPPGGSGGGLKIIHVDTFNDLPDASGVADSFYVVDDEPNLYFSMGDDWHCLTGWKIPEA